jgi:IclR family transcriptional regulator, acetate operon repressor
VSASLKGIARALEVFEVVAVNGPIGVSDLARRVGVPKSTVQRHLLSLEEAGWTRAVGGQDSTKWVATPKAVGLSRRAATDGTIAATAHETMLKLRDAVGETITLQVLNSKYEMVHIERVDSMQPVLTFIELGVVSPISVSAGGLAVLAHLPDYAVDQALGREIPQLTNATITDPDVVRKSLPGIRAQGYSVTLGQFRNGVRAVGAAVLNSSGYPVAGLGISIPESRFDPERVSWWGEQVHKAAQEVSEVTV